MTRLHFKFFGTRRNPWEGDGFASDIGAMLRGSEEFETVQEVDDADWIILVESNVFKPRSYLDEILDDPIIIERANDCFCINYEDDALGILPGLYAGLPKKRFEPSRHVATCYLKPFNEEDRQRADWLQHNRHAAPKHLLSFRGAMSHPVRKKMLAMSDELVGLGPITHVNRWFNHTDQEKESYWYEIIDSKFVLCPRGISPVSIRLFEVMQAGRVPVIIADEWVPPYGPDWATFSIRVDERDIEDIHEIVKSHARDWIEMGQAAREAWVHYYSPNVKLELALLALSEQQQRIKGTNAFSTLLEYKGSKRRRQMGWSLDQRLLNFIKRRIKRK